MDAQEYQPMTMNELIQHLQRFQQDAGHGGLYSRWLATILQPVLDAACEAGNSRLSAENQKDLNAFRTAELKREIERKSREVEALERDLKKVLAA